MKIWKLTPIDVTAPAFARASRWHDTAFVRSSDSNKARKIAQQCLSQAVKVTGRFEETIHPPWTSSALVACKEDVSGRFPFEGPEEVVWPVDLD